MKCPHCRFEWEPSKAKRLAWSLAGIGTMFVALVLCAVWMSLAALMFTH